MLSTRMRMSGAADFYPYKINQSCRFNAGDSAYLTRSMGSGDNRKKCSISIRFKRSNITGSSQYLISAGGTSTTRTRIFITGTEVLNIEDQNAGTQCDWVSDMLFRDVGSWYHVYVQIDTAQADVANRLKVYVNGLLRTGSGTIYTQNDDTQFGNNTTIRVGTLSYSAAGFWDGYMSEIIVTDDITTTYTDFGKEKNGIWIPKRYTGTYGTNGFHLDFADSGDLGNDVSGNNNDFTSSGLAADDQVLDSPTNNYPTISQLSLGVGTLSNGGLQTDSVTSGLASIKIPNIGKWYAEFTAASATVMVGIGTLERSPAAFLGSDVYGWTYHGGGNKYTGGSGFGYGASFTSNDVIGVAVDTTAKTITMYKNNVSQGEMFNALPDDLFFGTGQDAAGGIWNFGQLGFAYTPPSGFKALNSNNLPIPSIKDSSKGFDVVIWTGDDVDGRDIPVTFDPADGSLIWTKTRNVGYSHHLYDTVRGAGAEKELRSDEAFTEGSDTSEQYGYLSAFNTDGFRVSDGSVGNEYLNDGGNNYVAWCFRMGSKYGFDIIADEGTGIAHAINHNLGGTPELIIRKSRDSVQSWPVYHYHALNKTDPETDVAFLNITNAWADSNVYWNGTAPTLTQFTVGTDAAVNENTKNFITYLWRSIPQFSKVFSFEGNGNADGAFVYCGFRPRYLLIKNTVSATRSWWLHDTERSIMNPVNENLRADDPAVEDTTSCLDILSNGFKIRTTNTNWNASGITHVGIAYAEQPVKYSNAR